MQLLRLSLEENGMRCGWRGCTNCYNFSGTREIWGSSNYKDCEVEWPLLSTPDLVKKENDRFSPLNNSK